MHRCCPISCGTGRLSEEECNALEGSGNCKYPNDAQPSDECEFHLGDGRGEGEEYIGEYVGQDCANECRSRGGFSGATIRADGSPGCWCEKGQTHRSGTFYRNCMFSEVVSGRRVLDQ